MDHEKIRTFINITGASNSVAAAKLQAHGGDLNAAINSYFSEAENAVSQVQHSRTFHVDWMDEDESLPRQLMPLPFPEPLASSVGMRMPRFPSRGTPIVPQPRDVREIPIDCRDDDEARPGAQNGGILIEEVQETGDLPLRSYDNSIIVDDEETPIVTVPRLRNEVTERERGHSYSHGSFLSRNSNSMGPSLTELPSLSNGDAEDEMLRAAIEASRREAEETLIRDMPEFSMHVPSERDGLQSQENADIALAVSLPLKTAEQEKPMHERQGDLLPYPVKITKEYGSPPQNGEMNNFLKRRGSSSVVWDQMASPVDNVSTEEVEELDEEPLVRRRCGRRRSVAQRPPIDPQVSHDLDEVPMDIDNQNTSANSSNALQNDVWGGLSSEEQVEAVMLEAAMFGRLPENSMRFHYPTFGAEPLTNDDIATQKFRPIPQPPSPTVIAQRCLREQQDGEYLASLEADREKEMKAQREEEARRLKEVEAKAAAHAEEKLQQEEETRKQLAEEKQRREIEAKRAALPKEPLVDDESAVTLMVRMPDGSRQGRRFQKSDSLQSLFDFIDVSCGAMRGSYRLVRQYPRKAFTDAECKYSFRELELTSKNETLFLEQM